MSAKEPAPVRVLDGEVAYRDGSEDRILDILSGAEDRSTDSDELAARITDWPSRYHLSRQRANLLRPLDLRPGMRILEVGAGTGVLSRFLAETGAEVVALEGSMDRARAISVRCAGLDNVEVVCGALDAYDDPAGFDLVCIVGVLEYAASGAGGRSSHVEFLRHAATLRRPGGAVLVAIENQIGLKFLLGYREDHLGLPWVGIEGYAGEHGIRTFSRRVLGGLLSEAGLPSQTWFYPFPDYKLPTVVLADGIYALPHAADTVDQLVRYPVDDQGEQRTLICNDRLAHRVFLAAGLGREVANSFLVVASAPSEVPSVLPDPEIVAWRLGDDRGPRWRRRLAVRRTGRNLTVTSLADERSRTVTTAGWLLHDPIKDEPYVAGPTVEQLAIDGCDHHDREALESALLTWRWYLDQQLLQGPAGDGNPFLAPDAAPRLPAEFLDVALSNFVLGGDGLHFIDREWQARGGVEPTLVMTRALWLFARDVVRTGIDHFWPADTTVDGLASRLGELCGIDGGPRTLERMRAAEVELQHLVTGRPRDEILSDLEWVARQSRTSLEVCAGLPLTRVRDNMLAVAASLRQLEDSSRRREHELGGQLAEARDAGERLRGDLAVAREHLDGTVRELEAHTTELEAARGELQMWRAWHESFERKLPVRLVRRLRRLLGR